MSTVYDVIIVGGGPTGILCGVEAQKRGLSYLIIEKGVLVNSLFHFPANMTFFSTSKNLEIAETPFISHVDKPTRKEALEYYRRIVESYNLNIHYYEKVSSVTKHAGTFNVITKTGNYKSNNLVVATGFYDHANLLNIPGEELPKVKHYYDEAHRYVGQKIAIIGAKNSACDVALETWQKGAAVTMIIRGTEINPSVKYWILPNIENRIKEGAIKAYFDSEVTEIKPKSILIKTPDGPKELENDFVLAMTGYHPDYNLVNHLGIHIEGEHQVPVHNEDTLETNIAGLYIAGVLNAGLQSSKLFIENTRHHGQVIMEHILERV